MFSFLSNWRQTFSSSQGETDDVSSLNTSLNLPWPVTESSPRKNKNQVTPSTQQQSVNGMDMNYPIPKMTRPDDHPAAGLRGPSAPPTPPLHPFIPAPVPSSESVPWFQESAARRKNNLRTSLLQANAYAQHASTTDAFSPPPEVVHMDNNHDRSQMPLTGYHTGQHALYAYTTHHPCLYPNQYRHQTFHDENDEHEIYTSPFGHSDDDEDGFFRGPLPTNQTTPTSRRGSLKLHTASPFSQSTSRMNGLVLPPPPSNTSSHHTLPLPPVFPLPLPTVNTDVYNHAYNYPLVKQLSPIAEQDYFSPTSVRGLPGSAASASPGADSVLNIGFANGNEKEGITPEGDQEEKDKDWERASIKTRSIRTGSVGSAKAPAMTSASRSGSLSMREGAWDLNPSPSGSTTGSEITRPSPIYASPFITRHLNRTISQTSSNKSESPSQAQFQPSPSPAPTPPIPPTPQLHGATQSNNPSTPILTRITSMGSITPRLSTATITPANAYTKPSNSDNTNVAGSVQTPTSAATTTAGTMYTPNSAFPAPTPTSATTGIQIPPVAVLPCIPPLDGSHPSPKLSTDAEVPQLGTPKSMKRDAVHKLPVVRGSGIQSGAGEVFTVDEEAMDEEDGEDVESLHAESFVTATTNSNKDEGEDEKGSVESTIPAKDKSGSVRSTRTHTSQLPSTATSHSASGDSTIGDSFITRRWDRDAGFGLSLSPIAFRERKYRFFNSDSSFITNLTPAFWTFWLGFVFPVLWLVGGWHFTNLGEQPPKYTIWEWYFWRMGNGWVGYWWWKRVCDRWSCLGMRKGVRRSVEGLKNHKRGGSQQQQEMQMEMQGGQRRIPRPRTSYCPAKFRSGKVFPALPRWVAERQSTDDGRMRLNDPKRSLKGISFGYPFIPRPPYSRPQGSTVSSSTTAAAAGSLSVKKRVLMWIEKPNRVLDQLHGVKLREVRGRPESGRRMFDPWIQRCRYAFCWMMLVVAIGLCTACAYLIAVNTRRL